jgi:hypothetical protein
MCTRVTCKRCDKPTYAGCGRHIEQVLGGVAMGDRCRCREDDAIAKAAAKASAPKTAASTKPWWKPW